jgi:hypothetical protein
LGLTPRQNFIFGIIIVVVYVGLGLCIAIGKVNKDTSYGLDVPLDGLKVIGTAWAINVFNSRDRQPPKDPQ